MIYQSENRGTPSRGKGQLWGIVSISIEGIGSDMLGRVFVSERSIVASSIEVEKCQNVWVQTQAGG